MDAKLFRMDVFRCVCTALGKPTVSQKNRFYQKRRLKAMIHHGLPREKSRVVVLESWLKGVLQESKMGPSQPWVSGTDSCFDALFEQG